MMVIAIVGILAANAMISYKTDVALYFADKLSLAFCDTGSSSIKSAPTVSSTTALNSLIIVSGVITAIPNAYKGILTVKNCILTPTMNNESLTWIFSSGCVDANLIKFKYRFKDTHEIYFRCNTDKYACFLFDGFVFKLNWNNTL